MKEIYLKFFGVFLVAMILIFSISIFITQKGMEDINIDIEDVKDQPLSVRIISDIISGTSPLTVNFKPILLNTKNMPEFYWEFGDGNISTDENPVYVNKGTGKYFCRLTFIDGNKTVDDCLNVTVFPNNLPDVKILVDKTTDFRPAKIKLDAQVFDPECEKLTYIWKMKYPPFFSNEKIVTITEKKFQNLL
jgi:hypothetical protein